jgi:hypothetical protein
MMTMAVYHQSQSWRLQGEPEQHPFGGWRPDCSVVGEHNERLAFIDSCHSYHSIACSQSLEVTEGRLNVR